MNALRNRVLLIGRLGQDPERVELNEDRVKVNLRIATNEVHRNTEGDKVETTQWHNVVTWGALAEIAGQYLKKGVEIAIEGRLAYRTYEDSEGHTRYVTEVVAGEMLMLDRRPPEVKEA
jgi:single-strand DNA-binding protein